jgi:predicted component of type VI protein secretion system
VILTKTALEVTMQKSGRLICRTGQLAGTTFELGAETLIGVDAANQIVVTATRHLLAACHARIFARGDELYLEASDTGVTLDGAPVTGSARLDRMHVIGVGTAEFVFSRAAAATPTAGPAAGGAAADARASTAPPPPAVRASDTSVATPPAPAPRWPPGPSETTVLDPADFGLLPELQPRLPRRAAQPDLPTLPAPPRPARTAARIPPPPPASVLTAESRTAEGTAADLPDPGSLPTPPHDPETDAAVAPRPLGGDAEDRTVVVPLALELVVTAPGHAPRHIALLPGDNVIGRSDACEITIDDPDMWLSRRHANVRVSGGRIELVDLGTRNGTFVNGQRVNVMTMTPGMSFALGPHFEFTLRIR